MRHPLSIVVVATLLIAAVIDVFAFKTSAVTQFYYAAPTSGVGIAVPPGMKFPTELPQ
jgi:hypothetical protein